MTVHSLGMLDFPDPTLCAQVWIEKPVCSSCETGRYFYGTSSYIGAGMLESYGRVGTVAVAGNPFCSLIHHLPPCKRAVTSCINISGPLPRF